MVKFRVAGIFTASLARLQAPEQKAAKIAIFDLQSDPSAPDLRLHHIERLRHSAWATLQAKGSMTNVGFSHDAR